MIPPNGWAIPGAVLSSVNPLSEAKSDLRIDERRVEVEPEDLMKGHCSRFCRVAECGIDEAMESRWEWEGEKPVAERPLAFRMAPNSLWILRVRMAWSGEPL